MACPQCGNKLEGSFNICPKCGFKLSALTEKSAQGRCHIITLKNYINASPRSSFVVPQVNI